jgi:iron(III) transport system permease protein
MIRRYFGPHLAIAPWVLTALIAVLVLYPLVELIRESLGNLPALWAEAREFPHIGAIMVNTVLLGAGSMVLAIMAALVLAWCRANLAGRAGATAQVVAVLPLVIPPLAGVTGWAFLLSPKVGYLNAALRALPLLDDLRTGPFDVYSLPWIVIITGIYLIPYAFIFVQAGLANIDPRLEDAARIAGSGWWGVQCRIVLPLLRPALVYGGSVVGLLALGQFTAPLLLGRTSGIDVITTQIYRLTAVPPPNYPLGIFIALPILFLALAGVALQRRALRGGLRFVMAGKGVGRRRANHPLLLIPVFVYSLLVIIPPLVGLGLVALSPFWGGKLQVARLSLRAFEQIFDDPLIAQAITNSLWFSAVATLACLALSLCAALVATRAKGPVRGIIDYIINVPIAVPALLFGMGILMTFALGPVTRLLHRDLGINLYGSASVIILAYVVLVVPHGTRLLMSGLAQANPQLEAASRVFGSGAIGSVIRILVPVLRRDLVSAAMLMFMLSSNEFAASSLLVGPDTQVMSTVMFTQWDTGTYPRVAALALIMVAIAVLSLVLIAMFDMGGRLRWSKQGRGRV